MKKLKKLNALPKSGNEVLTDNGMATNYILLDFWRWSVSDILSNATRGRFAEFIVGTAIGLKPEKPRDEWGAFDLTTEDGITIEVKSAAYIQSWSQDKFSNITFSIKPARHWDPDKNRYSGEPKRHADLYVFCLLKHKDQETIDALKMEQWEFYIIPTYRIENFSKSQEKIGINPLKKLGNAFRYEELKNEIHKAYREQKLHAH